MIYDCFTFFNEFDLLEIRLNELKDLVDIFVIVEGAETFTGNPKPFWLTERKDQFAEFLPRMRIIQALQEAFTVPMDREAFQRNHLYRGLYDAEPDDTIMISDVDEIPKASTIRPRLFPPRLGKHNFLPLNQPMYMYYLNGFYTTKWNGTVIFPKRSLDAINGDCHKMRLMRRHGTPIRNSGWHFSWLGDENRVIEKAKAQSHTEHANSKLTNKERIRHRMAKGLAYGRSRPITYLPLDESFPQYLLDNREKFKSIVKEVEVGV